MCAIPPPNQLCLTKLPPQRGFYTAWHAGTHTAESIRNTLLADAVRHHFSLWLWVPDRRSLTLACPGRQWFDFRMQQQAAIASQRIATASSSLPAARYVPEFCCCV